MTDEERLRAQFVQAREIAMAHLTEITLGKPGDTSEAMKAWQLADLTLTLPTAMSSIANEAIAAWAEDTGRASADVVQELALRVAGKH